MKTIVKKAAIILMAVLTLASLSGCEFINVTTAYGLYSRSMEKIEDAGGYEADCTMSMTFDILGE